MTDNTSSAAPAKGRLRRPRQGRALGDVCAAVRRSLGVDSPGVRYVAVALAFVSAGTVVLVYLAWALIPQEAAGSAALDGRTSALRDGVRVPLQVEVGAGSRRDQRAGGMERRGERSARTGGRATTGAAARRRASRRSPADAADAALTGRRTAARPGVQESARRAAAQLAGAVSER